MKGILGPSGRSQARSNFLWDVYCLFLRMILQCYQSVSESQSHFEKHQRETLVFSTVSPEDVRFWLDWGRETESRKKGN